MLPFLTAYDPLSGSTSSIDPLGALQTYGALADLILPGITTITRRSRYLSVLCAALDLAERHRSFPQGATGAALRRRAIEPFERLWALACVAARNRGIEDAANGLRGITYAEKFYRGLIGDGRRVTPDFRLLKYQARAGAVGTYWTALEGGQLVDPDSGALTAEGRELACEFPKLPSSVDTECLADPDKARRVSMSLDELERWADDCNLAAAECTERKLLGEALVADDRRGCVAQALASLDRNRAVPAEWNIPALKRLRAALIRSPRADALGLPMALDAIIHLERFHEAALAIFESLLWWGTRNSEESVDAMFVESAFVLCVERLTETARKLLQFHAECDRPELRQAFDRLVPFARPIQHCSSAREAVDRILVWHQRVQSGKLDGGVPKREWVVLTGATRLLLRPSPRFQRMERPGLPTGRRLTHPYRLEPFIFMLRENDVLRRTQEAVA